MVFFIKFYYTCFNECWGKIMILETTKVSGIDALSVGEFICENTIKTILLLEISKTNN